MQEVFEKIIEKIKNVTHDNPMVTDNYILRCQAIKIIRQAATEYNNGWIPVDVSLPKEDAYVRVTIWSGHEWIGYYRDGKWFVYGSDGLAEATVLAWQPTQPYKPKGE